MSTVSERSEARTWAIATAAALVGLVVYYIPLLIPQTAAIRVHDNLDGEVVINHIIAEWLRDPDNANLLPLNGNLPVWALSRFSQPLTYLYLLGDAWHAYLLNDVIVRSFALIGAVALAKELGASPRVAVAGAFCYALSITYTVFGLSVAGLPMTLWIAVRPPPTTRLSRGLAGGALIAVGWNSSLFLTGIFFLLILIPIVRCLGRPVDRWTLTCAGAYFLGLMLGNWNVLFAQWISGIVWHRTEYAVAADQGASNLTRFVDNLIRIFGRLGPGYPWYHVSSPLTILLIGGAISAVRSKNTRRAATYLIGCTVLVAAFYSAMHTPAVSLARQELPEAIRSFQFDRFYFVSSTLILCVWIIAASAPGKTRNALFGFAAVQLIATISTTPHWKTLFELTRDNTSSPSTIGFWSYYRKDWFDAAKPHLHGGAVLSVDIDPMIAPMNDIPSLDGYYVMYPLEYKHRFREIIRESLPDSGKNQYFENWGNRIYTFHRKGDPGRIDFCAAYRLGARHVVSAVAIDSKVLHEVVVRHDGNASPWLYRIECGQ